MPSTTTETVRLTIDGIPISVPKGTLVIEAARRVGVMVPHFCYHPKLKPDANCRMCLVEVERMPKLQTSCSTVATEGMAVRTATTVVHNAHKSVLEFILANHPLDCPVCDQGGRCDLQDFSHEYTPTTSRFIEVKRVVVGVYSCEKSCRSQRPPWSQTGQSSGWLARINSSTDLCAWVTTGVAVRTTMPSATGVLQEVCNFGVFSISTKHMRQLASHFSLGW